MRGLRTPENDKFKKFFSEVQKKASEQEAVFFMDFGEGRDEEHQGMELDDLFGWLIPEKQAGDFDAEFRTGKIQNQWDEFTIWCIPTVKGKNVEIEFKNFI